MKVLYSNHGRVEAVLWYDYCKISEQKKSLGSGGYKDKDNFGYMWAETQIYDDGMEDRSLSEILDYVDSIKEHYPKYELYPSFFIKKSKYGEHE